MPPSYRTIVVLVSAALISIHSPTAAESQIVAEPNTRALAVNQDGSLNSGSNPATPNSIVTIWHGES
jgi:hypothetical protein